MFSPVDQPQPEHGLTRLAPFATAHSGRFVALFVVHVPISISEVFDIFQVQFGFRLTLSVVCAIRKYVFFRSFVVNTYTHTHRIHM